MNDRPVEREKSLATETGGAATAPHHPFAPAPPSRWLGVAFRLFVLVLVGGLIAFVANEWDWWVGSAVLQTTDDAYLHADLTPLAAKVPGYIRDMPVRDFQKVKAGDLLVQIEDDDYRASLEQAEANVAASEAAIQGIEQQKLLQAALIEQAEAAIQGAEADVTRYHLETVRQQKLLAGGLAGTLQIVEQAIDNEQRAKATLELDRAKLQQEREQINVLDSQAKQARGNSRRPEGGAGSREDQPRLHPHRRAGRRHGRPAIGPARPISQHRDTGDLAGAASRHLGHRQLQGDADDKHSRRPEGASYG